jgi:hypothetical protein
MRKINNTKMSLTPDERLDMEQALAILRTTLRREREKRRAWQAWALVLEVQMRREGWTQDDLDDLETGKPE